MYLISTSTSTTTPLPPPSVRPGLDGRSHLERQQRLGDAPLVQRSGQFQQQVDDGQVVARDHAAALGEEDDADGVAQPQRQPAGPAQRVQPKRGRGEM